MVELTGATTTLGKGFTVTVIFAVEEHPPAFVPVTVYVVVAVGLATGFAIFGLSRPVTGDQE